MKSYIVENSYPGYVLVTFTDGRVVSSTQTMNVSSTTVVPMFPVVSGTQDSYGELSSAATPSDASAPIGGISSSFGSSVAIDPLGTSALVGGPTDNGEAGAVWYYVRDTSSTWTQASPIISGPASSYFGNSISLSADGQTALIGGYKDASMTGAAWIYTKGTSGTWFMTTKLTASDAIGPANQGFSVALSANGKTAVVGGPGDNGSEGAAWIYSCENTVSSTWTQITKLTSGVSGTNEFGRSVAISANGKEIAVGSPFQNSGAGIVWSYTPNASGTWFAVSGTTITPSDASGTSNFGYSVAISASGKRLLVGGPNDDNGIGAAWVYDAAISSGTVVWSQYYNKMTGVNPIGAAPQGSSVAINADGHKLYVGAPDDDGGNGAFWLYAWGNVSGTGYIPELQKHVGSGSTGAAKMGSSISVSADGMSVLLGGPQNNNTQGATWLFVP
jgi:hypothetical protein